MSYRCTHYPIGSAKRNAKDAVRRMTLKFTKARGTAIAAAMTIGAMIWTAAAQAAECPRKGALGISRVLRVDAATSPRVGLKSFPQSLPLGDREVVLTFDDGPWPGTTPKVLAALARECVLATFFLIGKPASEHPELERILQALATPSDTTPGRIPATRGCNCAKLEIRVVFRGLRRHSWPRL